MPEAMVHTANMEGAGVIIVEDESIIAMDIAAVLAQRGYRVLATVADADEAVAKTGELSPDIVLMDIVLDNGQSGIDAARRINDLYDIPVLYVTSHADENTVRRARAAGPYGYILKPVSDAELLISIEMVLYRHSLDRRLRASEEKYRRLFDNIRDVFFQTDTNGTIVLISPSVERVAGFPPGELLGRDVATLYVNRDRRAAALCILGGQGYLENFEAQLRKKDGDIFWASISEQVVRDASGRDTGSEGSIRDITEQKTAEIRIDEISRQQKALLDNIPDMAWLKDSSGSYIAVNHAFEEASGFPRDEVIGKNDLDIWPAEYAVKFLRDDAEVIRSGRKLLIEERITGRSGREVWIETVKMPIRNERNEVYGTVGIARDIMERRQAEEALREGERTLRTLINANPEALFLVDVKGNILAANKTLAKDLGRKLDELAGHCVYDFMPPDIAELFRGRIEESLRTACPVHFEHGGAESFFDDYVYPIEDRDGSVSRLAVFVKDITEHRRAGEEIKRLSREIMISQEQERQKVARDLHDGVGQTIIAAKLNFCAFQKDRRKYGDRFEMGLQFIDKASQELGEVYMGLYPSILSDLGLEAAIRWYAKNYLEASGITTSLNLSAGKLSHDIEVNLYRMTQEIVSNIIRHSGAGSVNIELSRPGTGGAVVLAVEDDGVGFDPARVDELKKGFGLSNLRQRAEALGGEAGFCSGPGRSTRIAIWIPLRQAHE
ncbi:MAG TPA: PAS domain S-box protein [Spirochaetota bacterium]|nr:PAS domain S-box protein [Spirochaetota bacterium]